MNEDITLVTLDAKARKFADAYNTLSSEVTALQRSIEDLKRAMLPAIKKAAAAVAERRSALSADIQAVPFLFQRPRTLVLSGVKVGFRKGRGGLEVDDPERVVERIKKLFPDREDLLHVKTTPDKEALCKLPAADLKRLGCEIKDAADQVVVEPVTGDIDKLVAAFLQELEEEEA